MSELKKIEEGMYVLPKVGDMLVPGLVIGTEDLFDEFDLERPLDQVRNVAHLPGIVGYSIAMPDIHWGYGFPIGGVAATDAEHGVISPGGVGYDINCGVRLAVIDIPYTEMDKKVCDQLIHAIYRNVPSGVGKGHKKKHQLDDSDYRELINKGAKWSVEQRLGLPQDLEHTESLGVIEGGDIDAVSGHARDRGRTQVGSIGSGNHFVEIGEVQKIFDPEIAEAWGLRKGMIYVLIHSGSRGFGHQVCQDTLDQFIKQGFEKGLPDKQLVAAPLDSPEGKRYFQAMAAAANFAFNNRQQILHFVRKSFAEVMGLRGEEVRQIYDVCHNIAKFEEHEVEGTPTRLCVHRKGATRSFGPGADELAPIYRKTGQPVLVPGDMGRASHIMAGLGNAKTWCSCCHGAGRALSRHKSLKEWKSRDPVQHMAKQGVTVVANNRRTIAEEMPDAYKNVDQVVEAVHLAKLAKMVARTRPHLVLKG